MSFVLPQPDTFTAASSLLTQYLRTHHHCIAKRYEMRSPSLALLTTISSPSTAAFRYSALISPISVPEGQALSRYPHTGRYYMEICIQKMLHDHQTSSLFHLLRHGDLSSRVSISIFGLNSPYGSVSASVILIGRPVSVFIRNQ